MLNKTPQSIHVLPPLESGGVSARRGFSVQDHVSLDFCLELLINSSLKEVWCESQDDVTLIWDEDGNEKVEFVQVKGDEFDQLWSVAKLCERESRGGEVKIGTSILERSLMHDRCCEVCQFRMVTTRPVRDELRPLMYPPNSQSRMLATNEINALITQAGARVGDFKSDNNNGHDYWISNLLWCEIHSLDSKKNYNLIQLTGIVEERGEYLPLDKIEELYQKILGKIYNASQIRWRDDSQKKKFKKIDFIRWFDAQLAKIVYPIASGGGQLVEEKMRHASLPSDTISSANESRRRYREEVLKPQYMKIHDIRLIEGEISAVLLDLRSQLDAGIIVETGIQFHSRCLRKLSELRDRIELSPLPPLTFFQGYMYNIVGRCLHRFVRTEL